MNQFEEWCKRIYDEIRETIISEVDSLADGVPLYPSVIALKYGFDIDLIEICMDDLVKEELLHTKDENKGRDD